MESFPKIFHQRQPVPEWDVKADEYVLLNNVKVKASIWS
jgi:hypothetical protein